MSEALRRFFEENRRWMTLLLLAMGGNIVFWMTLNGPTQIRASLLRAKLSETRQAVSTALRDYGTARLEELLMDNAESGLSSLQRETFRSDRERFPTVDARIKEIAAKFRLAPQSIGYAYTPLVDERLEQLTVSFNLKGSYEDLRQFVREVEHATDEDGNDLFFSIEGVSLADSTKTGTELNLNIGVSTYFYKPELAERDAAQASARRRGAAR